jgi:hypothetical protein
VTFIVPPGATVVDERVSVTTGVAQTVPEINKIDPRKSAFNQGQWFKYVTDRISLKPLESNLAQELILITKGPWLFWEEKLIERSIVLAKLLRIVVAFKTDFQALKIHLIINFNRDS